MAVHIGMKRRWTGKKGRKFRLSLGVGLAPKAQKVIPAVTWEELLEAGIPFWRAGTILDQLARWVEQNPAQNQKEILLALARGYNRIK